MHYNFEWDPTKAQINEDKHGITFEEATQIFRDPLTLSLVDSDSSKDEDRWVTIGLINGVHYLVVVHTFISEDSNNTVIRIISARRATKNEIRQYEGE